MERLTLAAALKLSPRLPRLDREVLLAFVLKRDRVFLLAHGEKILTPSQQKKFENLLERLSHDEPVAYLTGVREFYGRNFFVGPGVLIPRPETELMVELMHEKLSRVKNIPVGKKKKKYAVIDVGTGSGAIIISLFLTLDVKQRKNFSWFAGEKESVALRYARKNAKQHAVSDQMVLKKSDLLKAFVRDLIGFDEIFVAANLPYLSTNLYHSTAANVQRYEPESALVSGDDGLDHYRALLQELQDLNDQGKQVCFWLEISPEQAVLLQKIIHASGLGRDCTIHPDLAGKPRVVSGTLLPSARNKQAKIPR